MDIPFSPLSVMMKLVLGELKKLRDFDQSCKDLESTMKMLAPLVKEIDKVQKRFEPGNKDLAFLHKTMRRAKRVVRECLDVGRYNSRKKGSYIEDIKEINADFLKFFRYYLPLTQYLDQFRSRVRASLEEDSNISTGRASSDGYEQFVAAVQESLYMEETSNISTGRASLDEDAAQIAAATQESLKMEESSPDEQRAILESLKYKSTRKKVEVNKQVLQESLKMQESSPEFKDEQRAILESLKDKSKGKQVEVNEQVAAALQEKLNMGGLSLREAYQEFQSAIIESFSLRQRGEQVANRRPRELYDEREWITNGPSSSTAKDLLDDEDLEEQRMLLKLFEK